MVCKRYIKKNTIDVQIKRRKWKAYGKFSTLWLYQSGKQKEYEDKYKARREQKKREKIKVLKRVGIPLSEYKELNTKEALN